MTDRGLLAPLIDEWREARRELTEMERAEHPDIVDHHGRAWTWISGNLYRHDSMAWPEVFIRDGRHGLPSPRLADNPNYRLCEICTKEWPPMNTDITPADVLTAVAAGADTAFDIAARLGVPHTSATLRHPLHDMVRDGVLDADDCDTRHFTITA